MNLIINADDFGMSKSINEAVVELCKMGSITSTSVMINMPFAKDIKDILIYNSVSIGLHINLTEGRPISLPSEVSSIVDKNGNFFPKKELLNRISDGEVVYEHIKAEVWAQFLALRKIVGYRLSHFDSHQGSTRISIVYRALVELKNYYKLNTSIRVHCKYYLCLRNGKIDITEPSISSVVKFGLKRITIEYLFRLKRNRWRKQFKTPDGFLVTCSHKTFDLLEIIANIDTFLEFNKTLEISCHPATNINDLNETQMREVRVKEYEILKSDFFRKSINQFNLISYNALANNTF